MWGRGAACWATAEVAVISAVGASTPANCEAKAEQPLSRTSRLFLPPPVCGEVGDPSPGSLLMSVLLCWRSAWSSSLSNDAAKSNVTHGGIYRLRVTRGRPVAAAVVRRAQVRAALQNLAGNS